MIKEINKKEVEICCGGNCPKVEAQNDRILIHDDFGNTASLSREEALFLTEAAKRVISWNPL